MKFSTKIIALTLALLGSLILPARISASATPVRDVDSLLRAPHFEISLGPAINIPGYWTEAQHTEKVYLPGPGGRLDLSWHLPLVHDFFLAPGLALTYGHYRQYPITLSFNPSTGQTHSVKPQIEKATLRIPVNFGILFQPSPGRNFTLFTGLEAIWCYWGRSNPENIAGTGIPHPLFGHDGIQKRCDIALGVGGKYYIGRFTTGLYATFGTVNLLRDSMLTFRENTVTLSVGYSL